MDEFDGAYAAVVQASAHCRPLPPSLPDPGERSGYARSARCTRPKSCRGPRKQSLPLPTPPYPAGLAERRAACVASAPNPQACGSSRPTSGVKCNQRNAAGMSPACRGGSARSQRPASGICYQEREVIGVRVRPSSSPATRAGFSRPWSSGAAIAIENRPALEQIPLPPRLLLQAANDGFGAEVAEETNLKASPLIKPNRMSDLSIDIDEDGFSSVSSTQSLAPKKDRSAHLDTTICQGSQSGGNSPHVGAEAKKALRTAGIQTKRKGSRPRSLAEFRQARALCQERRHETEYIAAKLRAFDRRWIKGLRHYCDDPEDHDGFSKVTTRAAASAAEGEETASLKVQSYSIVKWSSQLAPFLAVNLKDARDGRWDTSPGRVRNEFVTFELTGPAVAITSIELTLTGTSATPKRCRMQYSESSADGPWVDAWKFTVEANQPGSFRSLHQYGEAVMQFREMIVDFCGDVQAAWQYLHSSTDGRLTLSEFQGMLSRLRKQDDIWGQIDENQVFRDIDRDIAGVVRVEDLLPEEPPKAPEATWWRLLIVDNWGSPSSISLAAPTRLYTVTQEDKHDDTTSKVASKNTQPYLQKLVSFFRQDSELDPTEQMLRRLAAEYKFPHNDVEDMFRVFKLFDTSGDLILDKEEFQHLLLHCHGVTDKTDVPVSRLDALWRQVDQDGNGTVDFEEFLLWYRLFYEKMGKGVGGLGSPPTRRPSMIVPPALQLGKQKAPDTEVAKPPPEVPAAPAEPAQTADVETGVSRRRAAPGAAKKVSRYRRSLRHSVTQGGEDVAGRGAAWRRGISEASAGTKRQTTPRQGAAEEEKGRGASWKRQSSVGNPAPSGMKRQTTPRQGAEEEEAVRGTGWRRQSAGVADSLPAEKRPGIPRQAVEDRGRRMISKRQNTNSNEGSPTWRRQVTGGVEGKRPATPPMKRQTTPRHGN